MHARFLCTHFLSYQVGKSGLVIPRVVLRAGKVEEGFRRKAFFFFVQGLSWSPVWLNKPQIANLFGRERSRVMT